MTISIPAEKMNQVLEECSAWLNKTKANRRMVQSIAGRVIYIANCIPPARKFTARILATLRAMADQDWITINQEFKADIRWFVLYAQTSNGIHLFSPARPILYVECDSSLFGGGGVAPPFCYNWKYSAAHMKRYTDIHHLEALNILVAYQTLIIPQGITPAYVVIWNDNMASSWALTTGKTKDSVLAACARQMWLLAATNSHEIEIRHKNGIDIPLADALSRMSKDSIKARLVERALRNDYLQMIPPVINDYIFFNSDL